MMIGILSIVGYVSMGVLMAGYYEAWCSANDLHPNGTVPPVFLVAAFWPIGLCFYLALPLRAVGRRLGTWAFGHGRSRGRGNIL